MPIVIETYREFTTRHGATRSCDVVKLPGGPRPGIGQWLLPDGASVRNDGFGANHIEPPADAAARLQVQIAYWSARAEFVESCFRALKNAVTGWSEGGLPPNPLGWTWPQEKLGEPPPTHYASGDGSIRALERLAELVEEMRARQRFYTDEYNSLPAVAEERSRRDRLAKIAAEDRQERARLMNEAMAIRLPGDPVPYEPIVPEGPLDPGTVEMLRKFTTIDTREMEGEYSDE